MSPPVKAESRYSLQTRLVLAFSVLLIVFLGLAGLVLGRAYQQSLVAGVDERLQLQVYALMSVAEPDEDGFFVPEAALREARFSQPGSGLYGFIIDTNGTEVWRSPSALSLRLAEWDFDVGDVEPGQTTYGSMDTDDEALSWASYGTYWEAQDAEYNFVVMESTAPTQAQIREFQQNVYQWFGAMAVVLSIAQYLLLRWGLHPLKQLAADVSAIEAGAQDQMQRSYPDELKAVTDNLNLLIKSERDRQTRYRTTLGDLAHSLKTPLAVLSNALQEMREGTFTDQHRRDMEEQVERIDQIVSYQLKRVTRNKGHRVLAKPLPVAPLIKRILGALEKVYRDKSMDVVADIADNVLFYGEESDLMELCGNLLDNAFKYGTSKVEVKAATRGRNLVLEINDDGAGIAEADRQWVLERGARADTVRSGQGIGLAVAVEIVSAYGGAIEIEQSQWGGARFKVRLGA